MISAKVGSLRPLRMRFVPFLFLEPLRDASDEADMPPLEPLDDVPLSLR